MRRALRWRDTPVGESQDNAVEVNPPDDRFYHSWMPVRGEEIDAPSRALGELLREVDLGPARAQVDQWKSEQPTIMCFEDYRPPADLARIASQLRCRPTSRAFAGLARRHGKWGTQAVDDDEVDSALCHVQSQEPDKRTWRAIGIASRGGGAMRGPVNRNTTQSRSILETVASTAPGRKCGEKK